MGGGGPEEPPIPEPPRTFHTGRLPLESYACWTSERGNLSLAEWQQRRQLYEEVINEWTKGTGLQLVWAGECAAPDTLGTYQEQLRILLSDGHGSGAIPGCAQRHSGTTWSIPPSLHEDYRVCAWNMSLDSEIVAKSQLLHVAGHALGLVHHHFGSALDCPLDDPEGRTWSPYLEGTDEDSVMLRGFNNDPLDVEPDCHLTDEWDDGALSAGDRLSIQMLYPLSLERRILPIGSAMMFDGHWVFPEGQPLGFEYQWLKSGANRDWFREAMWSVSDPETAISFGASGLDGGFFVAAGQPVDVTLDFVDPFSEVHAGTTVAEVSNTKHAAVISTIF